MTESRIAAVARSVARGLSRRRLLAGFGGVSVAVAGLAVRPRSALVCQRVGKSCDARTGCCHGATCEDGVCACADGWSDCGGSGVCVNRDEDKHHCGRCGKSCAETTSRKTCCGGGCVDVAGDRANCGACGVACGDAELCVRGTCVGCPIDRVPCGNACCAPGRCDGERCRPDSPVVGAPEPATTTADRG